MSWLRAIPFLFTLLAFVLQPASASAFGPAHPQARVSAFELVAMASVGASAETSPGLHEGIGEAYDENASGYRFAARGASQVAPRVANAANHVFGPKSLAKHNLGGVLNAFKGDSVAAFNALEGAAQQLANQGAIKGVFQTTVEVAGQTVTVRGAVVEGVVKVGTAFIP